MFVEVKIKKRGHRSISKLQAFCLFTRPSGVYFVVRVCAIQSIPIGKENDLSHGDIVVAINVHCRHDDVFLRALSFVRRPRGARTAVQTTAALWSPYGMIYLQFFISNERKARFIRLVFRRAVWNITFSHKSLYAELSRVISRHENRLPKNPKNVISARQPWHTASARGRSAAIRRVSAVHRCVYGGAHDTYCYYYCIGYT